MAKRQDRYDRTSGSRMTPRDYDTLIVEHKRRIAQYKQDITNERAQIEFLALLKNNPHCSDYILAHYNSNTVEDAKDYIIGLRSRAADGLKRLLGEDIPKEDRLRFVNGGQSKRTFERGKKGRVSDKGLSK
jgi:hypothetical protein